MEWVRLQTHVVDHPRFLEAGPQARDLWTWGMLYAGRHETDGAIPMAAVLACPWGAGGRANIKVANRLVEVGLWGRTDAGYQVLRWAENGNPTRAELEADREAARERMKRRRSQPPENSESRIQCSGEQPPNVRANFARSSVNVPTSTSTSLSESSLGEGEGVGEGDAAPASEGGSQARYAAAYAEGVAAGKGGPYAWPETKYAQWDLGKIIATFAKDDAGKKYKGDQLLRWIRWAASAFAKDVTERDVVRFYSSFDPRGCLKWLNEQASAEEARNVG
jgi:hypothetical protein